MYGSWDRKAPLPAKQWQAACDDLGRIKDFPALLALIRTGVRARAHLHLKPPESQDQPDCDAKPSAETLPMQANATMGAAMQSKRTSFLAGDVATQASPTPTETDPQKLNRHVLSILPHCGTTPPASMCY